MIAATRPTRRPRGAKLLVVRADGEIIHAPRSRWVEFLNRGDLVIANDAATLPASLHGVHLPSGGAIEMRLAGTPSPSKSFFSPMNPVVAVVFGGGDFRIRTEDRPPPPSLAAGDRLALGPSTRAHENGDERSLRTGPLIATIDALLGHPRLVSMRFEGRASDVWAGLARHGRPIQYAHMASPLELWDVWTPLAAVPVAFEPPSAGFALDWAALRTIRDREIDFATLTHAAGISSTGDAALDRRLPFDEPYNIPASTARAIRRAQARGGRIVAVGTTVVRALEHAARRTGCVRSGGGVATGRVGPGSRLRVVDAILSGTHEPDSSHYELLRAFAGDDTLARSSAALEAHGYLTHEFGDSVLVEKADPYWLSNSPSTFPSVSETRA